MMLSILGCEGPYASHGNACSGYLLRGADNHTLMLDCGSGVLSQLPDNFPLDKLDGLVLTHLHPDHCADAFTLPHMLQFAKWEGKSDTLPVLLPDAPEGFASYFFENKYYDAVAFDPSQEFIIKHWHIVCIPVRHPVPAYAVRIEHEAEPGFSFVYTGDTNTYPPLVQFSMNADFLLADAMFLLKDWNENLPHMSASHAAGLASFAHVGKLLLTHMRPGTDPFPHIQEARKLFTHVDYARPHTLIDLNNVFM